MKDVILHISSHRARIQASCAKHTVSHFSPARKRYAFTLAEVLITLGVIGVVAAMTLPVISAKIQRTILNSQFKKSFSTLTNALSSTAFELDNDTDCFYISGDGTRKTSGCSAFWKDYFIKNNIKTIKICENNAFEQGCVPDYKFQTIAGCDGYSSDFINTTSYVAVAADGMIIVPYFDGVYFYPQALFDINGKKGPNKVGFDVYSFIIYKNSQKLFYGNSLVGCFNNNVDSKAVTKISDIMGK